MAALLRLLDQQESNAKGSAEEVQCFTDFQRVLNECLPQVSTGHWHMDPERQNESRVLDAVSNRYFDKCEPTETERRQQRRQTRVSALTGELWGTLWNAFGGGVFLMAPDSLTEKL